MNDCSVVESIFYFLSQHFYDSKVALCYVTVFFACAGCAVAELIGRFKGGNELKHIMLGRPQAFFYGLNALAGVFALYSSEALGSTEIIKTALSNLPKAIVQSAGVAVATFVALRTSISTIPSSKDGQKVEIGPGRLFAVLLENVGYRIELERAKHVADQIKKIDPIPTPRAILNFVLPYCFDQSENAHGNRKEELEKTLEQVMSGSRDVTSDERSTLMLNHLLPIFGTDVICAAISLASKDCITQADKVEDTRASSAEMLQFTEAELDRLQQKLTGKNMGGE